ncbi:hypothetical protein NSP_18420 [Nodularia spumigena CCY9414]|nr:hypothetical protein NSP_18420 [Nodularia spumigena CCY9414]
MGERSKRLVELALRISWRQRNKANIPLPIPHSPLPSMLTLGAEMTRTPG